MQENTRNLGLPRMFEAGHNLGAYKALDQIFDMIDALFGEETLTYAAEMTTFLTASTSDVTLGGDPTINLTPNPVPGLVYKLWIIQPAAGGPYTVTWGTPITWAGGVPPVLSTVAGKKNLIRCQYINSTLGWHCEMDSSVF